MDELSRLHKDVPFGWLQMLIDFLGARSVQRFEVDRGAWRDPRPSPGETPSDFHWLSAPH